MNAEQQELARAANRPQFRPDGQDDLAPSGAVARIRANLAALTTLRAIQREHRPATPDEQAMLARWSGLGRGPGGLRRPPAERTPGPATSCPACRHPAELAAAARNTLNAHYTDAALVQAIWAGVAAARLHRRPGPGTGLRQRATSSASRPAAPWSPASSSTRSPPQIAAALYPDADIACESFADSRVREGTFDLAIGNVPFGTFALTDRLHNPGGHSIHNHFIVKALHLVRPGGLVAVVTSRYTMDARNPAARREIAALADLVGAVRLPSGAHQRAAGTDVVTDLLIFRRREPGREPDRTGWEQTRTAETRRCPAPGQRILPRPPRRVLGELAPSTARTAPTTWSSPRPATPPRRWPAP